MALVSVVIPVFNGERHIGLAIDSVLQQTVPVHEIIVVNDGSIDGTGAVLRSYVDRIVVIDIPNGGVSNARNIGLQAATGDVIALLDADDVWRPDKVGAQLAVLNAHPGVEFTCCDFLSPRRAAGRQLTHFECLGLSWASQIDRIVSRPYALLLAENCVGTCSNVMFTRRLLTRVGLFDVGLKQAEDYDLWLRMALVTDFFLQSEVLLEKIAHENNLTNRFDLTLKCHEAVLEKFKRERPDLFGADVALGDIHARAMAQVQYEIAGILYAKGLNREGRSYLLRSWRSDDSWRHGLRCMLRLIRRSLT